MGNIFQAFCRFLDEDDWRYRALEEKTIIKFGIQGETADFDCFVDIKLDRHLCILYVIAPNRVPSAKRTQVAEFLTRANYGLILGCFELDMEDGEVRYRTSVQVEDSEMSQAMIKTMIYASIATMEGYYRGLMSIIYGDTTVMEAIKMCEKRPQEPDEIKAQLENLLEATPDDLPDD
jgi:hypothetical protein